MVVAIDFDGTLCEKDYPNIGEPNFPMIQKCIELRLLGHKLILWTCRCGVQLTEAIKWCEQWGLEFDSVNENLPEQRELYSELSTKICADIYVDDKNISFNEFYKLEMK